jgi:nitrate reductase NapE component
LNCGVCGAALSETVSNPKETSPTEEAVAKVRPQRDRSSRIVFLVIIMMAMGVLIFAAFLRSPLYWIVSGVVGLFGFIVTISAIDSMSGRYYRSPLFMRDAREDLEEVEERKEASGEAD